MKKYLLNFCLLISMTLSISACASHGLVKTDFAKTAHQINKEIVPPSTNTPIDVSPYFVNKISQGGSIDLLEQQLKQSGYWTSWRDIDGNKTGEELAEARRNAPRMFDHIEQEPEILYAAYDFHAMVSVFRYTKAHVFLKIYFDENRKIKKYEASYSTFKFEI